MHPTPGTLLDKGLQLGRRLTAGWNKSQPVDAKSKNAARAVKQAASGKGCPASQ